MWQERLSCGTLSILQIRFLSLCIFGKLGKSYAGGVFVLLLFVFCVFFRLCFRNFFFQYLSFFSLFFGYFEITVCSKFCFKYCWLKHCQNFALNILFFPLKFLQNIFEFKYCCFSPSIFENIVEICGPTFKIQGFSLYGNLYYWDIARTFPVQKSCAAFFAGTDSCLFTFSNGTKTCLFVFAGAQSAQTAKTKKSFSSYKKIKKRSTFLPKSWYRNPL